MASRTDLVRRFYEIFASGEVDRVDELLSEGWQLHPAQFGSDGSVQSEKDSVRMVHGMLDDLTYDIEEIHDCGDGTVACRTMLRGTRVGPFLGVEPTRARIELMTMEFHHVQDGRIHRTGHLEDFFGVQQQLLAAAGRAAGPATGA